MTCFETPAWTCGLVALLGLAACRMDNPAFDDGEGQADRADEVDTSADESGNSEETSSSGADTTDTTDPTDPPDTGDELESSDETIEVDLPGSDECLAEFTSPFAPIYGTLAKFEGQCPEAPTQYLKVISGGAGLVDGNRCEDLACLACGPEVFTVGVPGLTDFSGPLLELADNQPITCIKLQAADFAGVDLEDRCVYNALWIGHLASDLLLAVRTPTQLPTFGQLMLGNADPPSMGTMHVGCSCAQVYPAAEQTDDLDCCMGSTEPLTASLLFLGVEAWPGFPESVPLSGLFDYKFHVAQGQTLPNCLNKIEPGFDMSWALVRDSL